MAVTRYVLDSSAMEAWTEESGFTASVENAPELISLWWEAYGSLVSNDRVPEGFHNGQDFIMSASGLCFGVTDYAVFQKMARKARMILQVTLTGEARYVRLEDTALTFTISEPLHSVVIPYGVTRIGSFAFEDMYELTDVVIPDSVTEIDNFAFMDCRVLNGLVIPESVTSIGENAFPRVAGINQPYRLTLIVAPGSYAESYCMESDIPYTYP